MIKSKNVANASSAIPTSDHDFEKISRLHCKVYRAKRHVSSWVTTWTQLAAFGGSFCWWIRQKTNSVFCHSMIWIFQAQRNVELTRSFEMQVVLDVAAVSFERSNSRSREGSQLRRHGNFDWTTSSVDCGHSGNMGYLLDSGKPRSLSRFACLQQTLEDLPRKLDWKILQNLENHILAHLFWVASTLWLVMQLARVVWGYYHIVSTAALLAMAGHEICGLIATYLGSQQTQALIPHLKSRCLQLGILSWQCCKSAFLYKFINMSFRHQKRA